MKNLLSILFFFCITQVMGQLQSCPTNINFSDGTLNHWYGYTGLYTKGTARQSADQIFYDSTVISPNGTKDGETIPEYSLSSVGVQVITGNYQDPYGLFETIPTINGYSYNYSIRVGSTSINTTNTRNSPLGGIYRGIGYTIHVPDGPRTQPYVITYAYAMVLESAPHENNQVPMFTANLKTNTGTIECADAQYLLPTTANGANFILDQQAAIRQGFSQSSSPSPNNNGNNGESPYRIWTKGWTEVIFDLAQYRGQDVTLSFESDNCVPSGHFAYAYVALKNICAGLEISGTTIACSNGNLTYAIPELTGANYEWTIPNGWQTVKDSANTITVIPDSNPGVIIARATNSCADLKANINVTVTPPTISGTISGDTTTCLGLTANQMFPVTLNGNRGKVLKWISSVDNGLNWTNINDTSKVLNVTNISTSSIYRAIIQNGPACRIDSTNSAIITLNHKPVAGTISPDNIQVCLDQTMLNALTLNGSKGDLYNWQKSIDQINWINLPSTAADTSQGLTNIQGKTYFRAIVTNLGCPPDTSNKVNVGIYNVHFPKATIFPKDTTICYGTASNLTATILTGTSYQWANPSQIYNGGNGIVTNSPFLIQAKVAPSKKTDYIISIANAGCPNLLYDTIHVNVLAPLKVNAGRDTTVLIDQALQLNALQSDSRKTVYTWTPSTNLNSANISNPIATFDGSVDNVRYTVSIVDSIGCSASDNVLVSINRDGPNIFVPTGFTPNSDGKNDLLKPTVYGITQEYYFRVYNRWGQQVYFTTEIGKGWDGTWNGAIQPSGAYVFVSEGKDYLGRKITRTGSTVLIR